MTIRTTKNTDGNLLYNAMDICHAVGVSWRGKASLSDLKENKDFVKIKAPLQINNTTVAEVSHYAMTKKGVTKFCANKGADATAALIKGNILKSTTENTSEKRLTDLEEQVSKLKEIVATMMPTHPKVKLLEALGVDKATENATVNTEVDCATSRTELRTICLDHAKWLAEQHGVTEQKDMGIFYDLTFNLLYTKYKYKTNFDIKKEADSQNKTGLQIAQDYGIIHELLAFAKTILKTQ